MKRALVAAVRCIAVGTIALVQALTFVTLAVLAYQVFMRSALNAPPSWSEEVALLAFSWTVLLGIAYGVREGIHVRMNMLLELLPASLHIWADQAVTCVVTFVGLFLLVSGWNYVASSTGMTSAAIGYPMPLLYASVVVCGFLIVVFGFERLVLPVRDDRGTAEVDR